MSTSTLASKRYRSVNAEAQCEQSLTENLNCANDALNLSAELLRIETSERSLIRQEKRFATMSVLVSGLWRCAARCVFELRDVSQTSAHLLTLCKFLDNQFKMDDKLLLLLLNIVKILQNRLKLLHMFIFFSCR